MAKKLKAVNEGNEGQLAEVVRNSAQQIWQAGLGALVKAQREGGDAFAKLVKDGADVQQRSQQAVGEKASGVAQAVAKLADSIGKQAAGSLEKLGSVVEHRVSRSLHSLGVPTQTDIQALTLQIEQLNKSVNMLLGREAGTVKATAEKKTGEKKTPAKAARKTVAKPSRKPAVKPVAKAEIKPVAETVKLSAATEEAASAPAKKNVEPIASEA